MRALVATALLTFAFGLPAQEARFISSSHSPLTRIGFFEPNETRFSGKATINGTYEVLWEQDGEGNPGYFRVLLRPDAASQKLLPHDSERGPVTEIWIRNTDAALKELMSTSERKAIMSTKSQRLTGNVSVVITSYRTGVDCDQRGYNALLVSVTRSPINVAMSAIPETLDQC